MGFGGVKPAWDYYCYYFAITSSPPPSVMVSNWWIWQLWRMLTAASPVFFGGGSQGTHCTAHIVWWLAVPSETLWRCTVDLVMCWQGASTYRCTQNGAACTATLHVQTLTHSMCSGVCLRGIFTYSNVAVCCYVCILRPVLMYVRMYVCQYRRFTKWTLSLSNL